MRVNHLEGMVKIAKKKKINKIKEKEKEKIEPKALKKKKNKKTLNRGTLRNSMWNIYLIYIYGYISNACHLMWQLHIIPIISLLKCRVQRECHEISISTHQKMCGNRYSMAIMLDYESTPLTETLKIDMCESTACGHSGSLLVMPSFGWKTSRTTKIIFFIY